MPFKNNFNENLGFGLNNISHVKGISTFQRSLEKDFFAEVRIANSPNNASKINLVVEVIGNYKLNEVISVLNLTEDHEGKAVPRALHTPTCFTKAFLYLLEDNDGLVDVEEFTILLNDVTIVISKIFPQSIPDQLEVILDQIADHYINYTKGLTEMPYEIYVPVFEEGPFTRAPFPATRTIPLNSHNNYFEYWGIYYDSKEDAVIYDLKSKSMVSGELFMLNQ